MSNPNERRTLSFKNLDEVVAEVERLAGDEFRTSGNHSFGQIINHLALTHDMSTGKIAGPALPWYMKLMMKIMKPMLLKDKPLKPGVKLPQQGESFFWPDREFDVHEALAHLKESVKHYHTSGPLPIHPVFGKITREQNINLNCRHAALHLSFVHPVNSAS